MSAELVPAEPAAGGELAAAAVPLPREKNPYWVYLDSLRSPSSRRSMRGNLDRLARILADVDPDAPGAAAITGAAVPWHLLQYAHTMRLRALLLAKQERREWSAAYVNHHLVALRRVLQEAFRLGLMRAEDYQRARDIHQVKVTRLPAGAHVPDDDLAATLAACEEDETPMGRRDAALLAVLYSTGCRREEIADMTLADYDPGEGSIRVVGKGDKQRLVYLEANSQELLETWIGVRGRQPGPLFYGYFKGGRRVRMRGGRPAHLTGQAIANALTRRQAEAGAVRRTPHDFRRTFAGNLLDEGVDLATAQELMGHASPVTTARYDRRPERTRKDAVRRLRMPAPRKLSG
ncbi:tyrosine-type recombinase/integrase (plasmid) [Actinomadura sp. ATCC 31491]|uniref:Tyrosine-type recombinase/integrase n=1 Tax=Actinomadura luzonensis TaxID=2805427 RepID=A0ABT0GBW9_9ACTN|nr:tyrosine-type recombinase/integrase [Actinomadura luzonensis]MCK2222099.1 tyrosine-type recombinase/integrase [Actinomadura luzonensis]